MSPMPSSSNESLPRRWKQSRIRLFRNGLVVGMSEIASSALKVSGVSSMHRAEKSP